jgi:hypothetical protein
MAPLQPSSTFVIPAGALAERGEPGPSSSDLDARRVQRAVLAALSTELLGPGSALRAVRDDDHFLGNAAGGAALRKSTPDSAIT